MNVNESTDHVRRQTKAGEDTVEQLREVKAELVKLNFAITTAARSTFWQRLRWFLFGE